MLLSGIIATSMVIFSAYVKASITKIFPISFIWASQISLPSVEKMALWFIKGQSTIFKMLPDTASNTMIFFGIPVIIPLCPLLKSIPDTQNNDFTFIGPYRNVVRIIYIRKVNNALELSAMSISERGLLLPFTT